MRTYSRKDAGIRLVTTWKMFGKEISEDTYEMIMVALEDLAPEEIVTALTRYIKNPKNKTPPTAGEIIGIARPQVAVEDVAVLTAARVLESVSRFGWTNGAEAKEYIGEIGWQAVRAAGGWGFICKNLGVTLQVTTFQAQVRNLCTANQNLLASYKDPSAAIEHKPQGRLEAPKGEEET